MHTYLNNKPTNSPFSSHSYDIYNPFNAPYPAELTSRSNLSSTETSYLNRNLRAQTSDFIQQMRHEDQLIKTKQRQHYDLLYGQNNRNALNHINGNSQNLKIFSRIHNIHSTNNPFTSGQSQAIKQLKMRHQDAKILFMMQTEREQAQRMSQLKERQQNQQKLKSMVQDKNFRTIMELKNLEDYRRIKQAQNIRKQQEQLGLFSQRRSLLNLNRNQQQMQHSTLFSFATEQAKRYQQKMGSKFINSSIQENYSEQNEDIRFSFSGQKESRVTRFSPSKRPPKIRKPDGRDSLSSLRNSLDLSPRTIKLKNKTFYLIAS